MRFAMYLNRKSGPEYSGQKGSCLDCGLDVVAKCGEVNVWHWSHFVNNLNPEKCRYSKNYENESKWHLDWKFEFPEKLNEVPIIKNGIKKIADVSKNGKVIEFQNSDIDIDEINLRENHYGDMIWVLNGLERGRFYINDKGRYHSFSWKNRAKHFDFMKKPICVDIGNKVFYVKKSHGINGWGYVFEKQKFIDQCYKYLGINVWD